MNYLVYTKAAPHSPWRFTGIVESNREIADRVWTDITRKLKYHNYKLEWTTGYTPIDRSNEPTK
jgi:hypothetical protein